MEHNGRQYYSGVNWHGDNGYHDNVLIIFEIIDYYDNKSYNVFLICLFQLARSILSSMMGGLYHIFRKFDFFFLPVITFFLFLLCK